MEVAAYAPEDAEVTRYQDLHVTMNELQIPKKRSIRDLIARLKKVDYPAFEARIIGADVFNRVPSAKNQHHVAWLNPDGLSSWHIQELHKKILLSLRPAGYPVGRMDIRPHMTCLKMDFNADIEGMEQFLDRCSVHDFPSWNVDRFYLLRKHKAVHPRHPENNNGAGAKYEIISTFPLRRG